MNGPRTSRRYWRHERPGSYLLARIICRLIGHTDNHYEGGDCRRCWS